MKDIFERSSLLIGDEGLQKLNNSRVAVFGLGGVGGYVCEALGRCGVGTLDIIDADRVEPTNFNRQIIATAQTVGELKTKAFKDRILSINPDCKVNEYPVFFGKENAEDFDFLQYDYVVDAIDTVTSKVELAYLCEQCDTPIISSMGTGNKFYGNRFEVADIYETEVCPLCRAMRRLLKEKGVRGLKVVYSKEQPQKPKDGTDCGTLVFAPACAGLLIAQTVVEDLLKK
ncbi:MAG: tRNA threonylcarbamoyladenosine dehydratase [Oscillospiraceae bacterium]|nr:tRNA threonylcarbamoyladenosine dehydratase [Candidatus Equicaccousia limihippi]